MGGGEGLINLGCQGQVIEMRRELGDVLIIVVSKSEDAEGDGKVECWLVEHISRNELNEVVGDWCLPCRTHCQE